MPAMYVIFMLNIAKMLAQSGMYMHAYNYCLCLLLSCTRVGDIAQRLCGSCNVGDILFSNNIATR